MSNRSVALTRKDAARPKHFVGWPIHLLRLQLRSTPQKPAPLPFQRKQLLILMRAGVESAFAPGLPADRG